MNKDFENNNQSNNENTIDENIREETVHNQENTDDTNSDVQNIPDTVYMKSDEVFDNNSQNTSPDFSGGESYTKESPDGNITSGYVWNAKKVQKKERQKKTSTRSGMRIFTSILLCIFVLSFASLTVMVAHYISETNDKYDFEDTYIANKPSSSPSDFAVSAPGFTNTNALSIPQIAAKCQQSTVGILVEVETSYSFGFFTQQGVAKAVGSGFILSADGYVVTNHHVVDSAKKITVILHDHKELEAQLVGSDSISDIAVLKVEKPDGVTLTPVETGDSDNLVVGESVVAIGCPAGIEYLGTVTDGIISAINRNVEITDSYGRVQKTMTLIQTNATINKGNSGGPLINSKGQVIGINTLKLTSEYEGIGFSIPINGAMPIINQLIQHGKVVERTEEDFAYGSGMIGISGSPVTKEEAEHYGIPQGVLVFQIDKNSSAAKAGLRRGDIITHYNGQKVETVEDINNLKSNNRAGETVKVTVYRENDNSDGETFDISFKLDAQN